MLPTFIAIPNIVIVWSVAKKSMKRLGWLGVAYQMTLAATVSSRAPLAAGFPSRYERQKYIEPISDGREAVAV